MSPTLPLFVLAACHAGALRRQGRPARVVVRAGEGGLAERSDRPIETLIDQDLLRLDTLWAAAGTHHAVVSLQPHQLVQATGGSVIPVSASSAR